MLTLTGTCEVKLFRLKGQRVFQKDPDDFHQEPMRTMPRIGTPRPTPATRHILGVPVDKRVTPMRLHVAEERGEHQLFLLTEYLMAG